MTVCGGWLTGIALLSVNKVRKLGGISQEEHRGIVEDPIQVLANY
jgi:hypothetical protein